MNKQELSPKEIVNRLDEYIVGQHDAKKSVAIALRNRYRRLLIEGDIKKDITPKNILMIGPTGVGKTEIARRLADILHAPFTKVEATKFTEVGYVGRDVESMVRDLVEASMTLVRREKRKEVHHEAKSLAISRVAREIVAAEEEDSKSDKSGYQVGDNPFNDMVNAMGFNPGFSWYQKNSRQETKVSEETKEKRREVSEKIKKGDLDHQKITIHVEEKNLSLEGNPLASNFEQIGFDFAEMMNVFNPDKMVEREVTVKDAVEIYTNVEADKLVNTEDINGQAIELAENRGIIFLDEIDKIASKDSSSHAQISREGVQRDILPIVEGSVVKTKYGNVKTDYILFIGSGAFHQTSPSDLIPELQGRFPIRVELDDLTAEDFVRILTEPKNSLIKQYQALLSTENVNVKFTMDAIEEMAEIAHQVNENTDNIGARRLHTIIEKLLEDLLFEAGDMNMGEVNITKKYVVDKLEHIAENEDLSRYIL